MAPGPQYSEFWYCMFKSFENLKHRETNFAADPDGDSTFLYRGHWQADRVQGKKFVQRSPPTSSALGRLMRCTVRASCTARMVCTGVSLCRDLSLTVTGANRAKPVSLRNGLREGKGRFEYARSAVGSLVLLRVLLSAVDGKGHSELLRRRVGRGW